MGHRKKHAPRHGSLAYLPRKRAKSIKGKIKHWPETSEPRFLGFAGFKAGMTHIAYIETNPHSPYKDQELFSPVTVLETPPLLVYGVRVYKRAGYGLRAAGEVLAANVTKIKHLDRKIQLPKEHDFERGFSQLKSLCDSGKIVEVRALCSTQPHLVSVSRKKPDLFEIRVGGKTSGDALEFVKDYIGKEVRVFDILKAGNFIDVSAVSKGKGFQGPVRRFGIHRLQHKSRKAVRAVACLGPLHPYRIMWTVARAGQLGFHQRVEYNKLIMKVSEKGEEITPAGGFVRYGEIKGDYILIKGSVPGPKKRLVRIRFPIRGGRTEHGAPEITYVNLLSQQS